jgi:hypothetical protein
MAQYISVECPHCGKEVARLRPGGSQPDANHSPEQVTHTEVPLNVDSSLDELVARTYPLMAQYTCKLKRAGYDTIGDLLPLSYEEIFSILYRHNAVNWLTTAVRQTSGLRLARRLKA